MFSKLKNYILHFLFAIITFIYPIHCIWAENAEQLKKIECLTLSHNFDEALYTLNQAIEAEPSNAKLYKMKGFCLLISGSYEDAIKNYDKAIALGETSVNILTNKAAAFIGLQKYHEAFETTKKVLIKEEGKTAENYHHLCGALTGLERFEEAIIACDKAIILEPEYAQIRGTKASALYGLKKYKEALEECDIAIKLNPHLPALYFNKGLILQRLHLDQEALEMFKKATHLKSFK